MKELELHSRKTIFQQVPIEWKQMNLDHFNQEVLEERVNQSVSLKYRQTFVISSTGSSYQKME